MLSLDLFKSHFLLISQIPPQRHLLSTDLLSTGKESETWTSPCFLLIQQGRKITHCKNLIFSYVFPGKIPSLATESYRVKIYKISIIIEVSHDIAHFFLAFVTN